ncbi:hypothetical protein COCON_G00004260 [Conger conger]|uniref:Uncharacterized protein n=1 Tax=Conger conger TaxID=82655 RepID=A0A9Q1E181_CONCO|nr:hypothetical protein COCON_G00004260 [Conger conger]
MGYERRADLQERDVDKGRTNGISRPHLDFNLLLNRYTRSKAHHKRVGTCGSIKEFFAVVGVLGMSAERCLSPDR